jgi:hypothetical protein
VARDRRAWVDLGRVVERWRVAAIVRQRLLLEADDISRVRLLTDAAGLEGPARRSLERAITAAAVLAERAGAPTAPAGAGAWDALAEALAEALDVLLA